MPTSAAADNRLSDYHFCSLNLEYTLFLEVLGGNGGRTNGACDVPVIAAFEDTFYDSTLGSSGDFGDGLTISVQFHEHAVAGELFFFKIIVKNESKKQKKLSWSFMQSGGSGAR